MDTGHWNFPAEFDPNEWFGFCYRITELPTGRQYIGKKQFWAMRRIKVKGRKNRKKTYKESDWKTYTGSSAGLNASIAALGMDQFRFEIESLHETRGSLFYREVEMQIFEGVMKNLLPDGTPAYYNGNVAAVKFKVPPVTPREQEMTRQILLEARHTKK